MTEPVPNKNIGTVQTKSRLLKKITGKLWEILRDKDSPHKIALGMALGIFIGFLPIMGIQMAVVTLFALPLRGNLKAALAGVWISNPITFIPLYWLNYQFGTLFFSHRRVSWEEFGGEMVKASNWDWGAVKASIYSLLNMGADVFIPLWVGSAILALIFGVIAYFASYRWVVFYRKNKGHILHR
ncbi:MAG: DUF2062 domain-containing protein [Deltaproteobacteria bacterium]|nr:DUF2062 domain-containing protein [Deltaproteobacteria bacterium]MBN2670720.1 DUF2062 domain-containing protein [Deltaproteobacteria bacterium]